MSIQGVNGFVPMARPILTKEQKDANFEKAIDVSRQLYSKNVAACFKPEAGTTKTQANMHAQELLDKGVDEFHVKTLAGLTDEHFKTAEKLVDIGVDATYIRDMAKSEDKYQLNYMNSQIQKAQNGLAAYNQALMDLNSHGQEIYKQHFSM